MTTWQRRTRTKLSYALLLAILGTGTFGLFSDMELNFFVKSALMFLLLGGGGALLYFGVYLKGLRSNRGLRAIAKKPDLS